LKRTLAIAATPHWQLELAWLAELINRLTDFALPYSFAKSTPILFNNYQ
jgi:hypothetical protein